MSFNASHAQSKKCNLTSNALKHLPTDIFDSSSPSNVDIPSSLKTCKTSLSNKNTKTFSYKPELSSSQISTLSAINTATTVGSTSSSSSNSPLATKTTFIDCNAYGNDASNAKLMCSNDLIGTWNDHQLHKNKLDCNIPDPALSEPDLINESTKCINKTISCSSKSSVNAQENTKDTLSDGSLSIGFYKQLVGSPDSKLNQYIDQKLPDNFVVSCSQTTNEILNNSDININNAKHENVKSKVLLNKRELQSDTIEYVENSCKQDDSFDHILAQQYTDSCKDSKCSWKSDFLWSEYLDNAKYKFNDKVAWEKNFTRLEKPNNIEKSIKSSIETDSEDFDKSGTLLEQLAAATMAIDKTHLVEDSDEFVSNEYFSDAVGHSADIKRERYPPPPLGKIIDPEHYGINLAIRGDLVAASDVSEWEFPDIEKLKSLRDRLIQFMSDNHLKQADICRFTGLGAPYLSFMVKDPTISNFSSKRRVEVYSVLTTFFRKIESNEVTLEDISRLVLLSKATARASNSKKRVSGFSVPDNDRSFLIRRRRRGRPQNFSNLRKSSMLVSPTENSQSQCEDFSPSHNQVRQKEHEHYWQPPKAQKMDSIRNLSRLLFENFQNIKDNYSSIIQQTVDIIKHSQNQDEKSLRPDASIQAFLSFLYKGYVPQLNHISETLKAESLQHLIQSEIQRMDPSKYSYDHKFNQSSNDLFNAIADDLLSTSINRKLPHSYEAFLQTKEQAFNIENPPKVLNLPYVSVPSQSNSLTNSKSVHSITQIHNNVQSPTHSINSDSAKNTTKSPSRINSDYIVEDASSSSGSLCQKTSTPIICVASECNNQPNLSWHSNIKHNQNPSETKASESENSSSENFLMVADGSITDDSKLQKDARFHKLIKCTPHVTKPVILSLDRAPPMMHLFRPQIAEGSSSTTQLTSVSTNTISNLNSSNHASSCVTPNSQSTSSNLTMVQRQNSFTSSQNSRSTNFQTPVDKVEQTNVHQQDTKNVNSYNSKQNLLQKTNLQLSSKKLLSTIQSVVAQNDQNASTIDKKLNPEVRFGKNCTSQVDLNISATDMQEGSTNNKTMYSEEDFNVFDSNIILPKTGKVCPIRLQWKHGNLSGDEDILWDMNETGTAIESFVETYCHDMHLPLNPFLKELVKDFRKQVEAAKTFDSLFQAITLHLASLLRQKKPQVLPGMSRKLLIDCYRDGLRVIDVIPWNLYSSVFDAKNVSKKLISEMSLPPSFLSTMLPALLRAVVKEKMLLKNTLHEDIIVNQPFVLKVVSDGKKRQQSNASPPVMNAEMSVKKPKLSDSDSKDLNRSNNSTSAEKNLSTAEFLSNLLSTLPEIAESILVNSPSRKIFKESDILAQNNEILKSTEEEKLIESINESLKTSERYLSRYNDDLNNIKQLELRIPIVLRKPYPENPLNRHTIESAFKKTNRLSSTNDFMYLDSSLDSSQDSIDSNKFIRQKIS